MKLADMYGIVLTLVLAGMVLGVGILVMQNFTTSLETGSGAQTCALNGTTCSDAQLAVNATQTAISSLGTTWMAVIVIIVAAAIILGLVIRSFRGGN